MTDLRRAPDYEPEMCDAKGELLKCFIQLDENGMMLCCGWFARRLGDRHFLCRLFDGDVESSDDEARGRLIRMAVFSLDEMSAPLEGGDGGKRFEIYADSKMFTRRVNILTETREMRELERSGVAPDGHHAHT